MHACSIRVQKSPFIGGASDVEFVFNNIEYTLPAPAGVKCVLQLSHHAVLTVHLHFRARQVLNGVSGVVRSGEMLAIIGPSGSLAMALHFTYLSRDWRLTGAGKTSLLDILARRPRNGHVSGAILARGGSGNNGAQHPVLGYVTQGDFLFPCVWQSCSCLVCLADTA